MGAHTHRHKQLLRQKKTIYFLLKWGKKHRAQIANQMKSAAETTAAKANEERAWGQKKNLAQAKQTHKQLSARRRRCCCAVGCSRNVRAKEAKGFLHAQHSCRHRCTKFGFKRRKRKREGDRERKRECSCVCARFNGLSKLEMFFTRIITKHLFDFIVCSFRTFATCSVECTARKGGVKRAMLQLHN